MRLLAALLLSLMLVLQYRLWLTDAGVSEAERLRSALEAQQAENDRLRERNAALKAEVKDLKEGMEAVEERARNELGMIGEEETFYHVVPAETPEDGDDG